MPSPFSGMNPFLEQDDVWHDFHENFMPAIAEPLVVQARPKSIVKSGEHIYVHEQISEPLRRLLGRADVAVAESHAGMGRQAGAAVLDAPVQVQVPFLDVERVANVEIRDRRSRELITVVEVLSPSNKRSGADRDQYLAKRQTLLGSPVHLVEVDLLRGGKPMPLSGRPACTYSVLVSRAEDRPQAAFWPFGLHDPLPEIVVPLRDPDGPARLDLQAALHHVYDASGYEDYVYSGSPDPPLGPEDRAWAEAFVPPRPV